METNCIAGKWVIEKCGRRVWPMSFLQSVSGHTDGYIYAKCQSGVETWQVSTIYQFLFNLWELKCVTR